MMRQENFGTDTLSIIGNAGKAPSLYPDYGADSPPSTGLSASIIWLSKIPGFFMQPFCTRNVTCDRVY
jgi:hypothetical protein